jgi:hypothetical protein
MGKKTRGLEIATECLEQIAGARQVIDRVAELLKQLATKFVDLVNSAIADFCSLPLKERKARDCRLFALRCMSQVCDNALRAVDCVSDLMWYLSPEGMQIVSDQVKEGNFGPLHYHLTQTMKHVLRTEDSYQEFSTSCDEASRNTFKYAQSCYNDAQAVLRKQKKIETTGIMGSLLQVVTGVGITAATIVAGVFTAGVGAVVGLGSTGLSVAVTASVTASIANEYRKTAKMLLSFAEKFDTLCKASFQFQVLLSDVKRHSDNVTEVLMTTSQSLDFALPTEIISIELDRLADRGKELSSSISSCKSNLTAKRDEIANEISKE